MRELELEVDAAASATGTRIFAEELAFAFEKVLVVDCKSLVYRTLPTIPLPADEVLQETTSYGTCLRSWRETTTE